MESEKKEVEDRKRANEEERERLKTWLDNFKDENEIIVVIYPMPKKSCPYYVEPKASSTSAGSSTTTGTTGTTGEDGTTSEVPISTTTE